MQTGKVYPIGKVRYNTWKKVFETEVTASTPSNQLLSTFQGNHGATSGNADTGQVQTFAGTAQIVAPENPTFVGTAALDSVVKKFGRTSLLLDGNSDYITVPDSTDWYFDGDLTIDCWARWAVAPAAYDAICGQYVDSNNYWYVMVYTAAGTSSVLFYIRDSGVTRLAFGATVVPVVGTWHHIAVSRSGNNWYIFFDGVSKTLSKIAGDYSASFVDLAVALRVGEVGLNYFPGHIDEFRISKGIARWTADFTVPTSPYTADYQTPLLLHFAGTDGGTTTSNSGSRGRVGQSSLLLDGNSDYVTVPDSDDWSFGSGDFTIDCWVKLDTIQTNNMFYLQQTTDNDNRIVFYYNNDSKQFVFYVRSSASYLALYRYNTTISTNTWYHLALVRSGENMYLFIDGDLKTWTTITTPISTNSVPNYTSPLIIGGDSSVTFFDGQFDGYRVTKGTALWTSNFTPPSTSEDYAGTKVVPILNLQGDIDEQYMLDVNVLSEGDTDNIVMLINGDTGNNYGFQYLRGTDTAITAARVTSEANIVIGYTSADNRVSSGRLLIYAKKGQIRTILNQAGRDITSTTVYDLLMRPYSWNNSIDEVKSVAISSAANFGAGSTISLYKRETV